MKKEHLHRLYIKKSIKTLLRYFFIPLFIFGTLKGASVSARSEPVPQNIISKYNEIAQTQDCISNGGVMWVNGQFEPGVAAQVQQELGQIGINTFVEARSYGEMDSCGMYDHQGVDFTVTLLQTGLSVSLAQLEFTNEILPILTTYGKPNLGNIKLLDSLGEIIPVNTSITPLNNIQALGASQLLANAISKKVYVIVYDPLLTNGQKLSQYENWYDYSVLTQQTIDFFKQASNNLLNFAVVDTTVVSDKGWPELTDGFIYSEDTYLKVLSGQQTPHSSDVNYNKIINSVDFDICGKVNRGEIDEVWIYNGPWFGFYESTLAGPGAYYFNSLPLSGAHGCNRVVPIMGPSLQRPVSEAIHNFTHRVENTMKEVYGGWLQNSTSQNWNKFTLVKALSPNYAYSGCGNSHYPPNGIGNYDYANSSTVSSNCADFTNYPNLGDPLQVSQPVTCASWDCTTLGYYEYWFGHFPSNAGCGADNVSNNWWDYIANPALALYPSSACQPGVHIISGNVGLTENVTLTYTDGALKTVTSDSYGNYFLMVSNHWSGTIIPSIDGGYTFSVSVNYSDVQSDLYSQNYTATLNGPEMNLTGNGFTILDGDSTPSTTDFTDFGSAAVTGGMVSHTFTINNSGAGDLTLSGSPFVTISGANAGDFSVTAQPLSPITPSGSATFTVLFDPASSGVRTASISIADNDSNENPYNFSIQGFGDTLPEMDVQGNNVSISNGDFTPSSIDDTYFGSVPTASGSVSHMFTIYNTGGGNLNLTGSPIVTINGTNASDFSVTLQPLTPVAIAGSTTFTVVFDPSADGVRTAFVSIANDDSNENPYIFFIQGSGNFFPAMNVTGNGLQIASGDPSPNLLDGTDFSGALTTGGTRSNTFTINNTGTSSLTLTGMLFTGTNSSDFMVSVEPSPTVAPGSSTTFTIVFDPSASGLRTASLSIYNDDATKNPYTFAIRGTGVGPEINLTGNNITIIDGSNTPSISDDTDFGSTAIATGIVNHTFTIHNTGSDNLNLNGSPKVAISGTNASDFSVTTQPSSSVNYPSGTTTFTVAFDPSAAGLRTASISIANDDSNENPYTFSIQGTGVGSEIDIHGNNTSIANGDTTPSLLDHTDFGSVPMAAGMISHTFTIYNNGESNLALTGSPNKVTVTGANASDFTITAQPLSPIIPDDLTTFTVVFDPSVEGLRTASVSVANDDINKNPYTFSIQGFGTVDDPHVISINRASGSLTAAANVDFAVTFSESVTGVDPADFILTTTGAVSGAAVSGVSGSGSIYTVTVNTGIGNGNIRLDVPVSASIADSFGNPLFGSPYTSGETYSIIKSASFTDVPTSYWASSYIERLYNAGITGGCSTVPLNYCPDNTVTRAQMAVFLLKGMHSSSNTPPAVGAGTGFTDVATDYWAAAWIKQLAAEGITGGCGAGTYCPDATVTRAQMAVFLLKAKHGSSYSPPDAAGIFTDVPVGYWADKWIEQLASESITSGCGAGIYCPNNSVTRAQMAVFLVKTFNLP